WCPRGAAAPRVTLHRRLGRSRRGRRPPGRPAARRQRPGGDALPRLRRALPLEAQQGVDGGEGAAGGLKGDEKMPRIRVASVIVLSALAFVPALAAATP